MTARRLACLGVAAAVALLIGAGCQTSRKAPPHAFSSEAAATRPLPHRFRAGSEHDAALARTGNPYVLEVPLATGGALLYYGASHGRERSDPQVADITARWEAFAPTIALCEGRQSRHWFGFLVEPFAGLPEPTLVHKLARRDDVQLQSLEPEYADEVAALLGRFTPDQVALYYFLRVYTSEAGGQADEGLARDLLAKRTDVDGLRGALPDLAAVDALWQRDFPGEPDWRVLVEEPRCGWLAEVSDASRTARGEHMARVLLDLLDQGERVFAVVGSGHVIRQEWALRAALALEPAWDQPQGISAPGVGARAEDVADQPVVEARPLEVVALANAGFLLRSGDQAVLIDAFLAVSYAGYDALPPDVLGQLEAAEAPFDGVDLALVSHEHADHVQAAPARAFLAASPQTLLATSPQALAVILGDDDERDPGAVPAHESHLPEPGATTTLVRSGVTVEFLRLSHGEQLPDLQNLGHVITIGGQRVLHLGDAAIEPDAFRPYALAGRALDVALVPYWYFLDGAGRELVDEQLLARHVIACHIPAGERAEVAETLAATHPRVVVPAEPLQRWTIAPADR